MALHPLCAGRRNQKRHLMAKTGTTYAYASDQDLSFRKRVCTLVHSTAYDCDLLTGRLQRMFCGCGKPVATEGIWTCKHCGLATLLDEYEFDRDKQLKRIYAQLGTSVDGRSEDAILSQLG